MSFWSGEKVLVTGGGGFIGSHLVERLLEVEAKVRIADDLKRRTRNNLEAVERDVELITGDLADPEICTKVCQNMDIVMHLAAKIRGIDYNVKHHGEIFFPNTLMNLLMMEAARQEGMERYLS